jgi:hypothetical protein
VSGAGSAKVNARPKAAKGMPAGIIFIIHPPEMLSNGAATPNFSLRLGFSLTETCRMWGVVMKLVFELAHGLAGLHSALKQTPTQTKSGPEGPPCNLVLVGLACLLRIKLRLRSKIA